MVCRDFILPEPASYVFFYAFSNLRKLLYIIQQRDDAGDGVLPHELAYALRHQKLISGFHIIHLSFKKIKMRKSQHIRTYAFLLHDLIMNFSPFPQKDARRFCNRIYAEMPHVVDLL